MCSSKSPLVSVVIPTYNCAKFIAGTLDSVLNQTFRDIEIIVVNDGSTDDTEKVLQKYMGKIRYYFKENQGVSAARNFGIVDSQGKYIAFLDADDLWMPNKLAWQVNALENNSKYDIAYSNYCFINESGNFLCEGVKRKKICSGKLFEKIITRKVVAHPITWLVRRKCFDEIGLFDTKLKRSEDHEMISRLSNKFMLFGIKEPLAQLRQRANSLGRCNAADREIYRFRGIGKIIFNNRSNPFIKKNKNKIKADYLLLSAQAYLKEGNLKTARKRIFAAIKRNPAHIKSYFYLLSTLLSSKIFLSLKKTRKWLLNVLVKQK